MAGGFEALIPAHKNERTEDEEKSLKDASRPGLPFHLAQELTNQPDGPARGPNNHIRLRSEDTEGSIEGSIEDDEEDDDDDDYRFLEVCMEGDVEDLVVLLEDMARSGDVLTPEILNCVDHSGRSPVSHLCGNGMVEMLELLEDIPAIDFNLPDLEGNTPLHFAAQAGHVDVVSFLLNKIRTIVIDPVNNQGFTPLIKAAIQGRIKCAKLLLFSGASPIRRDPGRGFTAAQWARYCGRILCAESIDKFVRQAVPGGAALADEAVEDRDGKFPFKRTTSKGRLLGFGTSHKRNSTGGTGSGWDSDGSNLGGKSGGSGNWIARKLKKAFLPLGANSSSASQSSVKFSVPALQVTKDVSFTEVEEDDDSEHLLTPPPPPIGDQTNPLIQATQVGRSLSESSPKNEDALIQGCTNKSQKNKKSSNGIATSHENNNENNSSSQKLKSRFKKKFL